QSYPLLYRDVLSYFIVCYGMPTLVTGRMDDPRPTDAPRLSIRRQQFCRGHTIFLTEAVRLFC
ncbi:MAG: hypothetical protein M3Z49_03335, partial [Bifidobacteriales bacterium]|nr:hypothetical protein [Bifidobacteriales bacterium]